MGRESKLYLIGLSLGQSGDSSGLSVAQAIQPFGSGYDSPSECPGNLLTLSVKHLHRFPPGTKYLDMSEHILEVKRQIVIEEEKLSPTVAVQTYLVVDQTAVGPAIVEIIEQEVKRIPVTKVVIRGQDESDADSLYQIPKRNLIGLIRVFLEKERLQIAQDLDQTSTLVQELMKYQERPTSAASLSIDAWREQPADDLIFATALACWKSQHLGSLRVDNSFWS